MWETQLKIVVSSVTEKEPLTFSKTPEERGTHHPKSCSLLLWPAGPAG